MFSARQFFREAGNSNIQIEDFGYSGSHGATVGTLCITMHVVGRNPSLFVGWTCQRDGGFLLRKWIYDFNCVPGSEDRITVGLEMLIHNDVPTWSKKNP